MTSMRIPFLLALLLTTALRPAFAQEDDAARRDTIAEVDGAGFVAIGPAFLDIDDLDDRLEGAGYPTFGRTSLSLGGGGYAVVDGVLMIGGEGYGVFSGENAFEGRSVSMGGGFGFFDLGYLLRPAPRLRVYPMLGIGGGGLSLNIGSSGDADSFDEVLDDPGREASVSRGSFLLDLSAGAEYRTGVAGLGIGLRAGYVLAPYSGSWGLDGDTLDDEPDGSLAGPYVRLLVLP